MMIAFRDFATSWDERIERRMGQHSGLYAGRRWWFGRFP
jgi:hypothetical protein